MNLSFEWNAEFLGGDTNFPSFGLLASEASALDLADFGVEVPDLPLVFLDLGRGGGLNMVLKRFNVISG